VTEYCTNGSLQTYLQSNILDVDSIVKMVRGIAAGMFHLATEGICHRDLAARNILLDGNLRPKVADFGLARFTVTESEAPSSTKTETGPLKWMAPECLEKRQYSEKKRCLVIRCSHLGNH